MRMAMTRPKNAPMAFWDEHSLEEQRFYNLVCWVYGSDPDRFANLVSDHVLPAQRAARCSEDFNGLVAAFNKDLGPHIRR